MMSFEDVIDILRLGVIGLGFLLAFFSYRLLSKEQGKKEPRLSIIKPIYRYMVFSLVLCGIVIVSQLVLKPQAIDDAIFYLNSFHKYEMEASRLYEKAEELVENPNQEVQGQLNSEIESLIRSVKMKRRNSERYQQQLNGELDELDDALQKGEASAINKALKVLKGTLDSKRESLMRELKQSQSNSVAPKVEKKLEKGKITVRLFNVHGDARMSLNNVEFMWARSGFKGITPGEGYLGQNTPRNWESLGRDEPGDSGEMDITSKLKVGANTLEFNLWGNDTLFYKDPTWIASLSVEVKDEGEIIFSNTFRKPGDKTQGHRYKKTFTIEFGLIDWLLFRLKRIFNKFSK